MTSGTRSQRSIGAAPTVQQLKSHVQDPCPFCDDGRYDADEYGDVDEDATCNCCEGDRRYTWGAGGSEYEEKGECDHCRRTNIGVERFEDEWICLRCVIAGHRAWCGCALWRHAEAWDQDPLTQMEVALDAAEDERGPLA